MKKIFRLRHKDGTGHIDFDDYWPFLSAMVQNGVWLPYLLSVNSHGLVMSERFLEKHELNSDRLWFLKRGESG